MSWYSNIASRVNNSVSTLSRNLLNSEADGDVEDDTHVCRVLRNYYTEKGTGLPTWLPPDPKAPAPPPAVAAYQQQQQQQQLAPTQSAGGLSSLWDKNRGASTTPQQATAGPRNPFTAGRSPVEAQAPPMRPQMSVGGAARAGGSYGGGGSGAGSIQDRLKGRLGGGARTVSPGNGGGQGPFAPPAAPARGMSGSGDYDPYKAGGGNPYASESGGGGGAPSSDRRAGGGLPSGPRRMGGLPSGPRMR